MLINILYPRLRKKDQNQGSCLQKDHKNKELLKISLILMIHCGFGRFKVNGPKIKNR